MEDDAAEPPSRMRSSQQLLIGPEAVRGNRRVLARTGVAAELESVKQITPHGSGRVRMRT